MYLDESGFAHDMPRTHGYSPRGKCCISDWGTKGRTNVIGTVLGASLLTVSLFSCNINSDVFHAWAVQDLLPALPGNAVIVMDNATFHKRQDTQQAIKQAGHILEYLLPYSPYLNPIEPKWAQAKVVRRKHDCEIDTLFQEYDL